MKNKKIALLVIAGAFLLHVLPAQGASKVFWIESGFSEPVLVSSDSVGGSLLSQPLFTGSLPQALVYNRTADKLYWGELLFTNAHLRSGSTDFSTINAVVSGLSAVRGVAVSDSAPQRIFWSTTDLVSGPAITIAALNGSNPKVIHHFGPGSSETPFDLAIDDHSGKVYWSNFSGGTIERSDTLVNAPIDTILSGLNGPIGIVIDPDSGTLFWTEGAGNSIGKSKLDGSGKSTVIQSLFYPNYLALDRVAKRLYWSEMNSQEIRSAEYDGSHSLIVSKTANIPTGIAIVSSTQVVHAVVPVPVSLNGYPKKYQFSALSIIPAEGAARLSFALPRQSRVVVTVYSLNSRIVKRVLDAERGAGYYFEVVSITGFAPGTYLFKMNAGPFSRIIPGLIVR
jgi:DNA-binding beta-propeller fold protein YncE